MTEEQIKQFEADLDSDIQLLEEMLADYEEEIVVQTAIEEEFIHHKVEGLKIIKEFEVELLSELDALEAQGK
ncbi:MAG: hypothetical protein R3A13_08190 [Bdellovibrionota bacterium]